MGIEKLLGAEKGREKIAVEIKNFASASKVSEFHTALGQFINYRTALRLEEPERILYLAVPSAIYDDFFNLPFTQIILNKNHLIIIIYDVEKEKIISWKS